MYLYNALVIVIMYACIYMQYERSRGRLRSFTSVSIQAPNEDDFYRD